MNPYRRVPSADQKAFVKRARAAFVARMQASAFAANQEPTYRVDFDEEHNSADGPVDRFDVTGLRDAGVFSALVSRGVEVDVADNAIYVPHRYYRSQQMCPTNCDGPLVLNVMCAFCFSVVFFCASAYLQMGGWKIAERQESGL